MSLTTAETVLSRINQAEMLVARGQASQVLDNLRQLAKAGLVSRDQEQLMSERQRAELVMSYGYRESVREKPFAYADGIAIIPIHGTLLNRFSYSWGFVTGYNFIRSQMNAALDDEDVQMIVFDVNSGGGEAAGCFELSAEIREARGQKSLLAVVDSNCFSAAYALASGCEKVIVTPSGSAGSIGVISMHVEISKALKDAGIAVTIIAEDEHKADGNPYEPLPKGVLEDIRKSVAKRYGEFVDLVTTNRSLDSQAVRDTQSRCYRADEALELGLIDDVKTPANAVAGFLAELGSDDPDQTEDEDMADETNNDKATAPDAQALAAARTEGAQAERARQKGILEHAEAADRPAAAQSLAMNTDLSVEAAGAALAAMPKETKAAPAAEKKEGEGEQQSTTRKPGDGMNHFQQAMDTSKQPEVGSDGEGAQGEQGSKPSRGRAAMAAAGFTQKAKS